MTQHLTPADVALYRTNQLRGDDLLRVTDHLVECNACREGAGDPLIIRTIDRFVSALAAEMPEHLSYDEMETFVDGRVDDADQEAITSHIDGCATCAEEIRDLRAMAQRRPRRMPTPFFWAAAASVVAAIGAMLILRTPTSPPLLARSHARVLASLRDGDRTITLDSDGRVRGVPAAAQGLAAALLRAPRLAAPQFLADLAPATTDAVTRGSASHQSLALIAPVGNVLLDDRPQLAWRGAAGSRFEVTVTDADLNVVASSGPLTATHWTPPHSLPRGTTLLWQVASTGREHAVAPPRPHPPARFRVADAASLALIADARRSGSHLLLGAAYARAGLRRESQREIERLARQNPGSSIAQQLLDSMAAWR